MAAPRSLFSLAAAPSSFSRLRPASSAAVSELRSTRPLFLALSRLADGLHKNE